jgi:short-subunit dehydrogenase
VAATSERRVAFITGASSGIGAACVRVFASAGWDVLAVARRRERLEELAAAVRAAFPAATVRPLACDVNSDASVTAAFGEARAAFGRLDALVNNAGFGTYGAVADTPLDRFRENMETNFFGVLRCTQAAIPLLRETARRSPRRWGASIVMVSSIVGRRSFPGMSAYCASKFAVEGLAEALRAELAADRVAVSVVNPGVTKTEFFASSKGERPKEYVPPRRGMTPEAVARAILKATSRPHRNLYLTLEGKAGMVVQWFSPGLFDLVMSRMWRKRKR